MDKIFTRFITYSDITENLNPDILPDSFGTDALSVQIMTDFVSFSYVPDNKVVSELFDRIRSECKIKLK